MPSLRLLLTAGLVAGLLSPACAQVQVDTFRVGRPLPYFKALPEGREQYLRYIVKPNGKRLVADLWTREISFPTLDGRRVLQIRQFWEAADTARGRYLLSVCEPETFRPLLHYTRSARAGVESYRFQDRQITGLDTAARNTKKDFTLTLREPTFNWELDIETLRAIPWRKNYAAVIPFYHPGGKTPPAFYTYTVEGSEKLRSADGQLVDCWIVTIEYPESKTRDRFWFSKKHHTFMKLEAQMPGGGKLYKVRLSNEA